MHRYARIEFERRFLVSALPEGTAWAVRRIRDRYLDGARIRLRSIDGRADGERETSRKLTQKIPFVNAPPGHQGELTTMYLDDAEYEALARLPAAVIAKTRYSFPPLGIDVFEGPLEGLLIAEMEFESEAQMADFEPPAYCGREISSDRRFACGTLARLSEAEARAFVLAVAGETRERGRRP
jgi:CYTH domain-containing protein